jgi:hypothetical protein
MGVKKHITGNCCAELPKQLVYPIDWLGDFGITAPLRSKCTVLGFQALGFRGFRVCCFGQVQKIWHYTGI